MKRVRLTKREKNIEKSLKQFIPVDKREYKQIKQAISKKKKTIDLDMPIGKLKRIKNFLPASGNLVIPKAAKKSDL